METRRIPGPVEISSLVIHLFNKYFFRAVRWDAVRKPDEVSYMRGRFSVSK